MRVCAQRGCMFGSAARTFQCSSLWRRQKWRTQTSRALRRRVRLLGLTNDARQAHVAAYTCNPVGLPETTHQQMHAQ
jgi:hypothetical protein